MPNDEDEDDDNDTVCDPGVPEGTNDCIYVHGHADNCPFAPDTPAGPWPDPTTQPQPPGMQQNLDANRGTPRQTLERAQKARTRFERILGE